MSGHRSWHVWCDGCSDAGTPNGDHSNGTLAEARREAKDHGWAHRYGKDWCKDCVEDGTVSAAGIRAKAARRKSGR